MPALPAFCGFAQDDGVFAQLFEDQHALGPQLLRLVLQRIDEGVYSCEAVLAAIPLRGWQLLEQVGISGAAFNQQGHKVFVCGEKFDQRSNPELDGHLFYGVFVAGECASVDISVIPGIFALNDDVHRSRHGIQCNAEGCAWKRLSGVEALRCPAWRRERATTLRLPPRAKDLHQRGAATWLRCEAERPPQWSAAER